MSMKSTRENLMHTLKAAIAAAPQEKRRALEEAFNEFMELRENTIYAKLVDQMFEAIYDGCED